MQGFEFGDQAGILAEVIREQQYSQGTKSMKSQRVSSTQHLFRVKIIICLENMSKVLIGDLSRNPDSKQERGEM